MTAAVLLSPWQGPLLGQEVLGERSPPATRPVCFKARALPSCRAFLLTEFSLSTSEFGDQNRSEDHLRWDLGAMVNVTRKDAVGLSLGFGEAESGRWGAALRYRRWILENAAVEIAPGFVSRGGGAYPRETRVTGDVSLVLGGWVALFGYVEETGDGPRIGTGARFGAWPGAILGLLSYAFIGIVPTT